MHFFIIYYEITTFLNNDNNTKIKNITFCFKLMSNIKI